MGTSRADVLCGLGGNDTLAGLGGDDVLRGGPGADRLQADAGRDAMLGGYGSDVIWSYDGTHDHLYGGPGTTVRPAGTERSTPSGRSSPTRRRQPGVGSAFWIRSSRPIAYTTVMTTLGRLADKGLLRRHEEQPAHRYIPIMSREQYARVTVKSVVDWLIGHFPDPAVAYFVDRVEREDERVIERLREAIEQRRVECG